MPETPRITESEWQVMNVVWESPPVTAQEGVLEFEVDGKRYLYSPLVTREQSLAVEGKSMLGRLRGAPVSPLMAWFVRHSPMDKDEIEQLKQLLDKKEAEL